MALIIKTGFSARGYDRIQSLLYLVYNSFKGIIEFAGIDERYVFQGVNMNMDASPMGAWPNNCQRTSRIVFIGRNLDRVILNEGFKSCQVN